jgi:hypothetical protein
MEGLTDAKRTKDETAGSQETEQRHPYIATTRKASALACTFEKVSGSHIVGYLQSIFAQCRETRWISTARGFARQDHPKS